MKMPKTNCIPADYIFQIPESKAVHPETGKRLVPFEHYGISTVSLELLTMQRGNRKV